MAIVNSMPGENIDPVATPDTPPAPESAPEPAPAEPAAPAEPVLYETPDGRKVDAETLQREWKENFLPDYTRKSQKLAEIERASQPKDQDVPDWAKPDYVPRSYAEVIEIAKQEALADLQRRNEAEQQHRAQVAAQVDSQLAEIKAADPKLDENALFLHATKYGFRDLKLAHENYKTMRDAVAQAEARAVANIQSRGNTPVAVPAGSPPPSGDTVDPGIVKQFGSAREYLASLKS